MTPTLHCGTPWIPACATTSSTDSPELKLKTRTGLVCDRRSAHGGSGTHPRHVKSLHFAACLQARHCTPTVKVFMSWDAKTLVPQRERWRSGVSLLRPTTRDLNLRYGMTVLAMEIRSSMVVVTQTSDTQKASRRVAGLRGPEHRSPLIGRVQRPTPDIVSACRG